MLIFQLLTLLTLISVQISFCESFLIKNVDFLPEQFKRLRTESFYRENSGVSKVIVRRGDSFQFLVKLNEKYNGEHIQATLSFKTKKDRMVISLPSEKEESGWVIRQMGRYQRIVADIWIPGNASVGVWDMQLSLINSTGSVVEKLHSPHKIVVLFNPWSPVDAAYFPEQHKLNDYVLNEQGVLYHYNYVRWSARPWIYGQFQEKVLDAILFVLDRAKLTAAQRGDIVLVSRELTYLLNDDGRRNRGVLQGRWEEPYDEIDGRPATKPSEWTGSPSIFQQYYESGGKPVGFGQCWVFGGLLTTAYRALGIASRPVTNAVSAHSDQRDLTIDIFVNKTGGVVGQESVWNFHVWVQAWFSRSSDLGDDYSGWQELDATPQEINDRRYQVGPASTYALRKSELRSRFESSFLYEEVNADEVVWTVPDFEVIYVNPKKIGQAVVTKRYGFNGPEDITFMYKPPEGTPEERESYRLAAESLGLEPLSVTTPINPRSSKQPITIDIETSEQIMIGSPVFAQVSFENPSLSVKQLEVDITATAMYYDGKEVTDLKFETHNITFAGFKTTSIGFDITPEEYIGKLSETYTIRIQAIARIGNSVAFQKKLFSLQTPELIINAPKSVQINETFTMDVEIKNPFKQNLTNCYIAFEGTRIERKVIKIEDISGSSVEKATLQMESMYANTETVVVKFHSSDLLQMEASAEFDVYGKQSYHFANYVIMNWNSNENESTTEDNGIVPRTSSKVPTITSDNFECCTITSFE